MEPLTDYEHLGSEFWGRVTPDPDSDCLIFRSDACVPSFKGVTLLVALLGPARGKQRHRACQRNKCVNPDHITEGRVELHLPTQRHVGRGRLGKQRFERWYSQC